MRSLILIGNWFWLVLCFVVCRQVTNKKSLNFDGMSQETIELGSTSHDVLLFQDISHSSYYEAYYYTNTKEYYSLHILLVYIYRILAGVRRAPS